MKFTSLKLALGFMLYSIIKGDCPSKCTTCQGSSACTRWCSAANWCVSYSEISSNPSSSTDCTSCEPGYVVTKGCPSKGTDLVELFDKNSQYAVRCCSKDGKSCITPEKNDLSCSDYHSKTYDDAVKICEDDDRRICAVSETENCCQTGCYTDDKLMWVVKDLVCANDNDCKEEEICRDGECYDQQDSNLKCEADSECESSKKCFEGECKACSSKCKTCGDQSGYCAEWCSKWSLTGNGIGSKCDSSAYYMKYKTDCTGCDKSCTTNSDCPDVESCFNGVCHGCSWANPTGKTSVLKCNDGTYCNAITDIKGWSCCKEHHGRAKCPKDYPVMCSKKLCVDGTDYCCSTEDSNCSDYEDAPRSCEAYFEFYEGNGRTDDLLCTVPIADVQANKDSLTDKEVGYGCKNDEARSLALCNGYQGTKITVFDNGEFSLGDDWAVITVIKSFVGCVTIPTFETTQYVGGNKQVYVNYVTDGNLDGKVSSFKVELPKTKRVTLQAKEELENGAELVSSNKQYALRMQNDGNLVLYKLNLTDPNLIEKAIWASDTNGEGESPYRLVMQEDNHLIVFDNKDQVIWKTNVYIRDPQQWKKPGFAALQDDGNFVVRDGIWDVMWDSNTYGGKKGNYGEGNKHQTSCDSKCANCNDGQSCNDWCSSYGWCGSSEVYQWTDCRACH